MQAQLARILPEQKKLDLSMRRFREELAKTGLTPAVPSLGHQGSTESSGSGTVPTLEHQASSEGSGSGAVGGSGNSTGGT